MPSSSSLAAPLPYTVRSSVRAKRVTLRVVPGLGLVVSVPPRFARCDIPSLVEAHREWAESALETLDRHTPEICRVWPPPALELAATNRRVNIRWAASREGEGGANGGSGGAARWCDASTLELGLSPADRVGVATAIAAALKIEGQRVLVPRLAELAARHALVFARVAVRGQRSVWGSCSSNGTVSLNWKLLFLRPALVDYVLLHELAHTRHLDHSAAFWRLLERLEPTAPALDRELRAAGHLVPPWLELAGGRATAPTPRPAGGRGAG